MCFFFHIKCANCFCYESAISTCCSLLTTGTKINEVESKWKFQQLAYVTVVVYVFLTLPQILYFVPSSLSINKSTEGNILRDENVHCVVHALCIVDKTTCANIWKSRQESSLQQSSRYTHCNWYSPYLELWEQKGISMVSDEEALSFKILTFVFLSQMKKGYSSEGHFWGSSNRSRKRTYIIWTPFIL